jgi:hypothetical protein
VRTVLVLILGGVLLAFTWRALVPVTVRWGDEDEQRAAVDGTLALLGLPAALLTAGWVLARPGPTPVTRAGVALLGTALGGAVAWQVGDFLGTPPLGAVGAAFTWPTATAAMLFVGALLPATARRLNSDG